MRRNRAAAGARRRRSSPLRAALRPDTSLVGHVRDGLGALRSGDHACIDSSLRQRFSDSLDLDDALRAGHEQENRWDYLLGYAPSAVVVGLEAHSAKTDEVSTVIAKRAAAMRQLRSHLKPGARVWAWFWVASGRVQIAPLEKARLRLAQSGIAFVGRSLRRRDLAAAGIGGT